MNRPRKRDRHLPPCVYLHHGAYWLVKANRWTRLSADYGEALAVYARLAGAPDGSVAALIDEVHRAAVAKLRPNTAATYKAAADKVKSAFADFRAADVRPHHVAKFLDHYASTPAAANRARQILKQALALAVRRGLVDRNPVTEVARLEMAKRDRYLTDAEYQAIRAQAPEPLRCIMDLLYLTAERIGDVLKIREAQITADGIEVDQEKTGKRLLHAWTPDLRAAVAAARALHGTRRLYLLAQRNGRPRGYRGVRYHWDLACKRAKVADAHIHDLRAKALTDARKQGLDPQRLAGHTSAGTTLGYLRDRERDVVVGPSFTMRK
jgi:integrase